jgi:hypothetical protein
MKSANKFHFVFILCLFLQNSTYQKVNAQTMEKQLGISIDTTFDINILKSYLGRYDIDFGYGRILTFTQEGKQLYVQITGQPKTPVYLSSFAEFYWKNIDGLDAKVQFVNEGKGGVDQLFFFIDTQKFHAKKMIDEAPVEVDPAIFERYVGKYNLGDFMIIFSREGDNLYSQALVPGGPKIMLLPASDVEYFSYEASVRFKFLTGDDGNVNSIIVYINGQNMRGEKVKE